MEQRGRPRKHNEGELCVDCEINEKHFKGYSTAGNPIYRARCQECHNRRTNNPWGRHKGEVCEMCGYKPFWRRALDVHHRDGNKSNNEPSNLMTLCATCHRELEASIHDLSGEWEEAESWLKKALRKLM